MNRWQLVTHDGCIGEGSLEAMVAIGRLCAADSGAFMKWVRAD